MNRRRFETLIALGLVLGGIVLGALLGTIRYAEATQTGDANISLSYGFSYQNTNGGTGDAVINTGVYDGTSWQRLEGTSGSLNVVTKEAMDSPVVSTCATASAGAVSCGARTDCLYFAVANRNASGGNSVFISTVNTVTTTSNGTELPAKSSARYPASGTSVTLYCISATADTSIDCTCIYAP